ncbi:MAG: hypothetical protein WBM40_20205, partial [Thiohalocapsa sp.]
HIVEHAQITASIGGFRRRRAGVYSRGVAEMVADRTGLSLTTAGTQPHAGTIAGAMTTEP